MNMEYYVYQARGLNGVLLYIGQGSGNRYKHCNSGVSNNLELNRYYFTYGSDSITVNFLSFFKTKGEALKYEKSCIEKLKPLFNKDHNGKKKTISFKPTELTIEERFERGIKIDFCVVLRKYIQSIEDGDVGLTEMIEARSEMHKQFVEVLGVDKIKSIGLHKTKLTNAYNLAVKFNENNLTIRSLLKGLRVGGKYTSAVITNTLQEAYDQVGINRKAVSNDIKNYFTVEKTQVVNPEDGKRKQGFKLLSDLYSEDY